MPIQMIYTGAALGGALIALLVYHVAFVGPTLARLRHSIDLHDGLIGGGAGGAVDRFHAIEGAQAQTRSTLQALSDRIAVLETLAATDLSRAGFVRYDAFNDAESGLSYALALLNRKGDGVVLTSIYSRSDTRTYGKPVDAFKPTVHASSEEIEAIERARGSAAETTTQVS